jgi:hypothetical protein
MEKRALGRHQPCCQAPRRSRAWALSSPWRRDYEEQRLDHVSHQPACLQRCRLPHEPRSHRYRHPRVCYWTTKNIDRRHHRLLRAYGAWVGLALPTVRREERQRTNLWSHGWCDGVEVDDGGRGRWRTTDGIEGGGVNGVASREAELATMMGVGDNDRDQGWWWGHCRWHQGRRRGRRGVEGGGKGTEGGGVDGAASREAAAQRVGNLGSLTAQTKISLWLGFCVGGVTPLIPDTLLVSADIVQPIPIIFGIGWLTSADTDMLNLYITPTHHCSDRAPQWWRLQFRLRLTF